MVRAIIGDEEWNRRLKEEDGGITTVLGLHGNRKEADEIVTQMKRFLTQVWLKRQRHIKLSV